MTPDLLPMSERSKAGVPLTDYNRIGGSAVGGRSDKICSDYFPPIVSIPLPDRWTKSHIGNRKLPPIVGPKSDMADYRRLHPIIISPRHKSSYCNYPIFQPIFQATPRSSDQSGNGTPLHSQMVLSGILE